MDKTIVIKLEGNVVNAKRKFTDMDDSRMEYSCYARFFDVESSKWIPYYSNEQRLMWLKATQDYCNALLKNKGYLFLNDVYEMLGIPRSQAGQLVGWIYDEKNPMGDNYVDFDIYNDFNRDYINGEKTYKLLLDFNVDGCIIDRI